MIPFVVVGGLLQALGLLLDGRDLARDPAAVLTGALLHAPSGGAGQHTAAVLYTLGTLSFQLLAPVLAGYVAYALAGRPGLMPGITTGLAASVIGAGFLGALIGGILAGLVVEGLGRLTMPEALRGLASFLLVPLTATVISGGAMLAVIGPPVAAASQALGTWLSALGGSSAVLLGAVLGAMTAADLGGPLNKAAYTFAITGVTGVGTTAASTATAATGATGGRPLAVMAAVMAAGMVAPLACWLATRLQPSAFTQAEHRNGTAAGVLGALFISEGAIPFAAASPPVVIPSLMLGGAVAGASTMAFGVTLAAPHGGVLALFAVSHVLGFLASLALGAGSAAACPVLARQRGRARLRRSFRSADESATHQADDSSGRTTVEAEAVAGAEAMAGAEA
jgi:PTS system fructose-specific IIC component